jgi:hypothetical protein
MSFQNASCAAIQFLANATSGKLGVSLPSVSANLYDLWVHCSSASMAYLKLSTSSSGANDASVRDLPIHGNSVVILNLPPTTDWISAVTPTGGTATITAKLGWDGR